MRHPLSISVLLLSLAAASTVNAQDWFRMNISPTIFLGSGGQEEGPPDGGESELPPDHGQNSGERPVITANGGMFRTLAPVSIPVLVNNGSGGYVLEDDHPDLDIVLGDVDGEFTLEGALMSSATVRLTATDMLYAPAEPLDIVLNVFDMLVARGPSNLGVIRVGTPVAFDVTSEGGIGNIGWSLSGAPGLAIDASGHVTGTPAAGSYSIHAHATDDFDGAQNAVGPVSLMVQPNLSAAMNDIVVSSEQAFTSSPTVVGKIGALSWELADGSTSLPVGVSLHPVTGQISGQVEETTTGLRLAVTDAFDNQKATTNPFAISVVADTLPDPFSIASQSNVEPRWEVISTTVSPIGFDGLVPIVTPAGTLISVSNGPWVASATISEGQNFRLKVTAPEQAQTLTTNVTVGSGSPVSWSVTSWTETVRTIGSSTTTADPQALFGGFWTNSSIRKRLIIPAGVTVSSSASTTAALTINTSLQGGLIVENNGVIAGAGGNGGVAGDAYGKAGGDALVLNGTGIKIINTGTIAGGGGGGGLGGRGANGTKTVTLREPATGENYDSPNTLWFVGTTGSSSASWNGSSTAFSMTANVTSMSYGVYTYYRGTLRQSNNPTGTYRYGIWRTSSQTETVTGGTGGNGGKGATYPAASGSNGTSGQISPGSGAGAGGTGGKGGMYGSAGVAGNTGGTGTNGTPSAGSPGGASGYAIKGTPVAGSVLGTLFGQ